MSENATETFYDPEFNEDVTYYKPNYVQHLHKRIHNQRKQLERQNRQITDKKNKINDLEASLSFTDAKSKMIADELDDSLESNKHLNVMNSKNHQLKARLDYFQKHYKENQEKLIAINHVLRDDDSDEAKADDLLDMFMDPEDEATISIR